MSKLITKLNDLNKVVMPAMGFQRPVAQENHTSVVVLAELSAKNEDMVKSISDASIDAGILDSAGLTSAALTKCLKNKGNMITGLSLAAGKTNGLKLINEDIDFVVFGMDFPVSSFEGQDNESLGKILRLDLQMEPGLLRSAHILYPTVDAVMIDMRVATLTIENLITCKKIAEFTGVHVIAMVNKALTAVEIRALRESGVKGIVPGPDSTGDELKATLEIVKALPKPEKRKEIKSIPMLPQQSAKPSQPEPEEGDDDGE
jgi:hypothetical protein